MNNFEIHDAATGLAAGRTAYSLAREVLGLRAQVAELRDTLASMEAEEGQEITALRQELEATIEICQRQSAQLERKDRDLDTAQQQTERAIGQGQELADQLDEAQTLMLQLTASTFNLHSRCKELEEKEEARERTRAERAAGECDP